MKLLHTSDWHVGKKIRGHSRADEHRAVLAEIANMAAEEQVELVAVAGDLYETAAPTAESEQIVTEALLALAEVSPVVAVTGNHDNAHRFRALEPLLRLGRITMVSGPRPPDAGGVVEPAVESGTPVKVACLPFVSQRAIVRTADLMDNAAYENAQTYAARMERVVRALTDGFDSASVNLVVAHAFVHGARSGGGERAAHLVDEYGLSSVDFPPTAAYVALGHLHRPQQMLGPTAIHYCGSPLQLDFGEQEQAKQVNVIDLEPGLPAKVRPVPLRSGRPLRTLTGTVAELAALDVDDELGEAWLRVVVTEPGRAGLADEVREALGPGVVDVRVQSPTEPRRFDRGRREGRSPNQLFADYLAENSIEDPRLEARFADLHDDADVPAPGDDAPAAGDGGADGGVGANRAEPAEIDRRGTGRATASG